MKVVINACCGGFNLSPDAIRAYAATQGKQVYFYKQTAYQHRDGFARFEKFEPSEKTLLAYALHVDLGDTVDKLPGGDGTWFHDDDIARDDKDLVRIVEEMGERASGPCASLKVVNIPDGVNWEIEEYDGYEQVAESHRTWN